MSSSKRKYIVVLGSIMSGLGKGIVTSSLLRMIKIRGYDVVPIKFDGYLNVDCGTMNPFRHGEVFVLDDGAEVDMDFGTYERFLNKSLSSICSITGGKLFKTILEKERRGEYLGRDVQFIPHLTDEIKKRVLEAGEQTKADILIIEVGGTVGDLENGYFLEAMRQLSHDEEVLFLQLTYVHSLSKGEPKTKPTQHANRLIQSLGIKPEIILCREDEPLIKEAKEKIGLYCNINQESIYDDPYVNSVYKLPATLEKQGLYDDIAKRLRLRKKEVKVGKWRKYVKNIDRAKKEVNIALIGKYTSVKDAYVSVEEALVHSGATLNLKPKLTFVEANEIEKNGAKILKDCHGIIVPGGFGKRGIEGKISAIEYARKNNKAFLGLCLGMQMMVVEYARNVLGWKSANSTEFDKNTPYPVIDLLPEQQRIVEKGGTMRLGAYPAVIKKGTYAYECYGKEKIEERHRHRYEVTPRYTEKLEKEGLIFSGRSPKKQIVEMAEWKNRLGIATQAHPELKSRLEEPAPLFVGFLRNVVRVKKLSR